MKSATRFLQTKHFVIEEPPESSQKKDKTFTRTSDFNRKVEVDKVIVNDPLAEKKLKEKDSNRCN